MPWSFPYETKLSLKLQRFEFRQNQRHGSCACPLNRTESLPATPRSLTESQVRGMLMGSANFSCKGVRKTTHFNFLCLCMGQTMAYDSNAPSANKQSMPQDYDQQK